jgi:hypothetical protein
MFRFDISIGELAVCIHTGFDRLEELSEAKSSNHAARCSAEPCTCNATFDPQVATNGINEDLTSVVCERREKHRPFAPLNSGQFQYCFVRRAYAQLAIAIRLAQRDSPRIV